METWDWFMKTFNWSSIVFFILIVGAFAQYKASNEDEELKKSIKTDTEELNKTAKNTIDNLQSLSQSANESQEKANETFVKLNETYKNTLISISKAEETKSVIIENLKRTLEAKEAILNSQNDMISKLTGGDSYPFFTINNKGLKLNINGKHSIPNLHFEIFFLKDYLRQDSETFRKYLFSGELSSNIIKIYENNPQKLFVNKTYKNIDIPYVILKNIVEYSYSGIDIKFTSDFKTWSQAIRLKRNMFQSETIEICNVIYELKDSKSEDPFELAKRIKTETSQDFNLDSELMNKMAKQNLFDHLIIIYPKLEILDLKENEIEKTLNTYSVDEFRSKKL